MIFLYCLFVLFIVFLLRLMYKAVTKFATKSEKLVEEFSDKIDTKVNESDMREAIEFEKKILDGFQMSPFQEKLFVLRLEGIKKRVGVERFEREFYGSVISKAIEVEIEKRIPNNRLKDLRQLLEREDIFQDFDDIDVGVPRNEKGMEETENIKKIKEWYGYQKFENEVEKVVVERRNEENDLVEKIKLKIVKQAVAAEVERICPNKRLRDLKDQLYSIGTWNYEDIDVMFPQEGNDEKESEELKKMKEWYGYQKFESEVNKGVTERCNEEKQLIAEIKRKKEEQARLEIIEKEKRRKISEEEKNKINAELSLAGNKRIKTFIYEFEELFPYLSLDLYDSSMQNESVKTPLDKEQTIASARCKNARGGKVSICGTMKVKDLEQKIYSTFGLYCEVCYYGQDGQGYYTLGSNDEKTLASFNAECEKNGCKKGAWK